MNQDVIRDSEHVGLSYMQVVEGPGMDRLDVYLPALRLVVPPPGLLQLGKFSEQFRHGITGGVEIQRLGPVRPQVLHEEQAPAQSSVPREESTQLFGAWK